MAQQYVAFVRDEPIPGFTSHRVYGPFDSSKAALDAIAAYDLPKHTTKGFLLLREPSEIGKEVTKKGE